MQPSRRKAHTPRTTTKDRSLVVLLRRAEIVHLLPKSAMCRVVSFADQMDFFLPCH